MLPLRVWVHCPRASNGLLSPRSYLVGYVRWHARSDSVLLFLLQTIIPTAFSSQVGKPYLTGLGKSSPFEHNYKAAAIARVRGGRYAKFARHPQRPPRPLPPDQDQRRRLEVWANYSRSFRGLS